MFQHHNLTNIIWLAVGFSGQLLFSMRFIVQWLVSESKKQSIIPTAFWYFSIMGGVTLLAYSIYKKDPVFILGQAMGIVIYGRNLYFIHQQKNSKSKNAANNQYATDQK